MYKVVYVLRAVVVLIFFLSGCATTQILERPTPQTSEEPTRTAPTTFATSLDPLSLPLAQTDRIQPAQGSMSNTLSLDLGLQVINLKTSFIERKGNFDGLNEVLEKGLSRRYLNFLATSSSSGGGLQSEAEFSYYSMFDSLNGQCGCGEEPRMLRLSLKDRWAGFNVGADYRSLGRGWVFVTGQKVDEPRDEGQIWGEHSLGLFNLRGSIGESWERLSEINQFRLVKTAATTLNFNRPAWGGGWTSSFSLVRQGIDPTYDTTVFSQALTGSYRPINGLLLGSNFSFKQERNTSSGIRTGTPGTGLTFSYAPWPERVTLTGATSYTRSFSAGAANNAGTVDVMAGINWQLGRFFATEDVLSFNLKYNYAFGLISPSTSQQDFSGMLQLKIGGF